MSEQLHLWDDRDDDAVNLPLEYPTPAEPDPEPPAEPTTLDQDLKLYYYGYLGRSAERIASATEQSRDARSAEFVRLVGYELAIGKINAEQRDLLFEILRGERRYG